MRFLALRPASLFDDHVWPPNFGKDDRSETKPDIQVHSIKACPMSESVGIAINRCFSLEMNKSFLCSLSWEEVHPHTVSMIWIGFMCLNPLQHIICLHVCGAL